MKKALILFFLLMFCSSLRAQQDIRYQELIAKAGLFHLKKEFKSAVSTFELAFQIKQPDALNAYKAAGVYALSGDSIQALKFLQLAIDQGWTEADFLINDPYFDNIRLKSPQSWDKICVNALSKEKIYEKTLKNPILRKRINKMTLMDQQLRFQRVQSTTGPDLKLVNKLIAEADRTNLTAAKEILRQNGWPRISDVGPDGQNNFWLVVQHADTDIPFQTAALAQMKKLKGTRELNMENFAFLYDRIQCNLNYKQLYGTQVKWTSNGEASGFRPILEEDQADHRRLEAGLQTLRIYALTYGFAYTLVTKEQAMKQDATDLLEARRLLDSARLYFSHKKFQKAYDACNNASMIAGGLNDEQNYQAALVFARIVPLVHDPKYQSIAFDFLGLLKLRGTLNVERTKKQTEFQILHADPRWMALFY